MDSSRTELLIGRQNLDKLSNSSIIVFGVGGVGGYICETLVRAGIGAITIIDFDVVDSSNVNRQIIALQSTIGQNKVDVMKNRLLDINPNLKIETHNDKLTTDNCNKFFDKHYDYIVDAIDDVKAKITLIEYAHQNNIQIISSMGSGNRYSIPQFEITDIFKTENDRLARVMRQELRKTGIKKHTVLCSKNLPDHKGTTVASISYFPAVSGCMLSSYVINQLIKN